MTLLLILIGLVLLWLFAFLWSLDRPTSQPHHLDLRGEPVVSAATEPELLEMWRNAPCPIVIKREGEGTRITWGPDPLDFIILSPRHVDQLAEQLREARAHGR